jgi:hypothetical protein
MAAATGSLIRTNAKLADEGGLAAVPAHEKRRSCHCALSFMPGQSLGDLGDGEFGRTYF